MPNTSGPGGSVDDLAAYVRNRHEEEESSNKSWFRRRKDRAREIEVRRFAGPEAYLEQLAHLRIAHLTDLHVGRVTPIEVHHAAVQLTNEASPDLVVITGDFVCHSQEYLDALEAMLRGFHAPVLGVLGNHDYWSGGPEVIRAIRRAGGEVLQNSSTVLTLRHQTLQIVGLDDAYTGHCDREKALKGMHRELPTLGLTHIGEEADALWAAGVPLVLAGHTHAGQITLARMHEIALGRLGGHKYVHGLYGARRKDEAPHGALYVGAGLGASVMPLRIGERGRREIALFELGIEPGMFPEHHEEQRPLPGRKPSEQTRARRHAAVYEKARKRELRKK